MKGPSVVAFWRGTWDYANIWYDKVLFKKDYDLSNALAILLGLLLNFLLDMFHSSVKPLAGKVCTIDIVWRQKEGQNVVMRGCLDPHMAALGGAECVQRPLWDYRHSAVESK